jgi:hypothetical protein
MVGEEHDDGEDKDETWVYDRGGTCWWRRWGWYLGVSQRRNKMMEQMRMIPGYLYDRGNMIKEKMRMIPGYMV